MQRLFLVCPLWSLSDNHFCKLREKIGEGYISTVKGVGYKFSRQS
jgi:DNA-binding response OmpR family regulator